MIVRANVAQCTSPGRNAPMTKVLEGDHEANEGRQVPRGVACAPVAKRFLPRDSIRRLDSVTSAECGSASFRVR
jgi:hypothetical protein